MSPLPPISVKQRPSGEKLGSRYLPAYWEGITRLSSRLRVAASRITTDSSPRAAMNPLHGDQIASCGKVSVYKVAAAGSHEDGSPRTTLARGWVYCLYSSRMIEVWGDRGSAE